MKYIENQGVFLSKSPEIFECRKSRVAWSASFCCTITEILPFASPPPVAIAAALRNSRAEGMATGGGEAPLPLGAGAEVRNTCPI